MRASVTGAIIAFSVAAVFMLRPAFVADLDNLTGDALAGFAGRGKPSGQVAIVEIDESSIARFGRWPWSRDHMASLIQRVLNLGASTVVLDMVFDSRDQAAPAVQGLPPGDTNDDVMAGVMRGRPVVTGFAFRFNPVAPPPVNCGLMPAPITVTGPEGSVDKALFRADGALCNVPAIAAAAAGNGYLNAAPDSDGKLRSIPLVMQYGDGQYPSLALATVAVYLRGPAMQLRLNAGEASWLRVGERTIPLEGKAAMNLRFRGPKRTFPYVEAGELLDSSSGAEMLRGKIAIIGGSAIGLPNPVATPVDSALPDVEVQATAIDDLLQGDSFHRPPGVHFWEALLAIAAGLGAAILVARMRLLESGAILACGIAAAWCGSALLLWRGRVWFSPLPVIAVLACEFPAITILNYRREKRRVELTERQLESERATALATLRASESRYRRLVENINDAIVVEDAKGRLVFANGRFQDWFGAEAKDVCLFERRSCVSPEWRQKLSEWRVERMAGAGVPDRFEFEGVRSDGARIWIEASFTEVAEDGEAAGAQWVLRDITERKEMESRYLQAQKMESIGRLAGGVAHDFNNLLQVIIGYTDWLLRHRPDDEAYRRDLEEIAAAGEHAAELTRKLLLFSRKEIGRPVPLDLNEAVAEAQQMCSRLVGEDIELVTRLSPTPAMVVADSAQILQVLMNLVVNARDAMPRGGVIAIETRNVEPGADAPRTQPGLDRQPWVYLGVSDTGLGMNDHVKRHLFEPFFTTKEPGKGTGLGLATVYGIVTQNKGKIDVTSAVGAGTTIHLWLPRSGSERQIQSMEGAAAPAIKGRETILLVEDQNGVRRFLRTVLEEYNYRVLDAANGSDALELAKTSGPIDLLISDLIMPMMDGRELAQRLLEMQPNAKVIFVSGYARDSMEARWADTPSLVYLQKPFNPEQLITRIQDVLGKTG